jgi:hypothetical protein
MLSVFRVLCKGRSADLEHTVALCGRNCFVWTVQEFVCVKECNLYRLHASDSSFKIQQLHGQQKPCFSRIRLQYIASPWPQKPRYFHLTKHFSSIYIKFSLPFFLVVAIFFNSIIHYQLSLCPSFSVARYRTTEMFSLVTVFSNHTYSS